MTADVALESLEMKLFERNDILPESPLEKSFPCFIGILVIHLDLYYSSSCLIFAWIELSLISKKLNFFHFVLIDD